MFLYFMECAVVIVVSDLVIILLWSGSNISDRCGYFALPLVSSDERAPSLWEYVQYTLLLLRNAFAGLSYSGQPLPQPFCVDIPSRVRCVTLLLVVLIAFLGLCFPVFAAPPSFLH